MASLFSGLASPFDDSSVNKPTTPKTLPTRLPVPTTKTTSTTPLSKRLSLYGTTEDKTNEKSTQNTTTGTTTTSTTNALDLQDLNALARLRCWSMIEQCAGQVDTNHHTTLTEAGSAPLHSAICNGAPLTTIQALVVANPPSVAFPNHFGNLPLHFIAWKNKSCESLAICEFLLTYFPQAAKHVNRHGNVPLHHATNYKAHIDFIQLLWRANPTALSMKNDKGQTPLDHAIHRYGKNHDIVKMLQGSTTRNYVYQQHRQPQHQHHQPSSSPSPSTFLSAMDKLPTHHHYKTKEERRSTDSGDHRDLHVGSSFEQQQQQEDSHLPSPPSYHHEHQYSTANKEALPEIMTHTWHDVDLS